MPRKGPAPKRPLVNDPVYWSQLVTQLVNKVLLRLGVIDQGIAFFGELSTVWPSIAAVTRMTIHPAAA